MQTDIPIPAPWKQKQSACDRVLDRLEAQADAYVAKVGGGDLARLAYLVGLLRGQLRSAFYTVQDLQDEIKVLTAPEPEPCEDCAEISASFNRVMHCHSCKTKFREAAL